MAKACPTIICLHGILVTILLATATRYVPVGLETDNVHTVIFNNSIRGDYFMNSLGLNVSSVGVCDNPWNSCVGRCADTPVPGFYTCFCDALCQRYGDCCLDYGRECSVSNEDQMSKTRLRPDKFYLSCIKPNDELESTFGVLIVDRCPPTQRDDNETATHCEEDETLPVTSRVGDVFRNSYCAACHHIFQVTTWKKRTHCQDSSELLDSCYIEFVPPSNLPVPRPCLYQYGHCEDPTVPASVAAACGSYSGSVFHISGSFNKERPKNVSDAMNTTAYKNFHCAQCNGVPVESLKCPSWYISATFIHPNARSVPSPLQPHSTTRLSDVSLMLIKLVLFVDSIRSSNLPASFSVLFNFNLDGEDILFNSQGSAWWETTQAKCHSDELWDPFLGRCRKLMCANDNVVVDYQCVPNLNNSTLTASSDTANSVLRFDTSLVRVTLNLDISAFGDQTVPSVSQALEDDLIRMLARSLDLSEIRFTNYSLIEIVEVVRWESISTESRELSERPQEVSEMMAAASFVFSGCDNNTEPSIAMVMSAMSAGISTNKLLFYIGTNNSIIVRAVGIMEATLVREDNSAQWCNQGLVREYINEPFAIIYNMSDGGTSGFSLYMNETGNSYKKGDFLVSAVYQGTCDKSYANLSSSIMTCEHLPDPICESHIFLPLMPSEYVICGNGTLIYTGNSSLSAYYNPNEYICNSGNISICLRVQDIITVDENPGGYDWDSAYILRTVGTLLLSLSGVGTLITLLSYSLFDQLRNLPGANMVNLAFCILAFQVTFLAGMRQAVDDVACFYVAISLHYEILALFCWANVMAIDMYATFGTSKIKSSTRRKGKYLPRYMGYAYGVPAVIVGTCCAFNFCECVEGVVIGYALSNICWISEGKALALAFVLPLGVILLANFVLFALTVLRMKRNKEEKKRERISASNQKTGWRNDVKIYARMSSVMCFTWIFGFLMAIRGNPPWLYLTFEILFVLTNTTQGLMIFVAFVCNSRVIDLYRQRFRRCRKNPVNREHSRGAQIDQAGLRTLSTETFVSMVSSNTLQDDS